MSNTVLQIKDLSKRYRLGQINTGTLSHDLGEWLHNKFNNNQRNREEHSIKQVMPDDHIWALKDINLEIEHGEILGIIGRNGAGKSTLLKIISRITTPTEGQVKVKGKIASLLEVGTGMHPEMTARENIYLNGAILGMSKKEVTDKFDGIIDFADCEQFIDTPIKRFSSGMRVKLGFAVAAFLEPDILIVDEVLAVGDHDFQKKAVRKIKQITADEGRTILFVSHNMAAVKSMCSKCLLLEKGKIITAGSTEDVIETYRTSGVLNKIPLSGRKDRKGGGQIRFTGVSFHSNNKALNGQSVISNEDIQINIDYKSLAGNDLDNVHFSVSVKDQYEHLLFSCATRHVGEKFSSLKPDGTVQLEITSLPLVPGNYLLDLFCKVNETVADHVLNAVEFEVLDNDIYGTGIVPDRVKHGPVFVTHNWNTVEHV